MFNEHFLVFTLKIYNQEFTAICPIIIRTKPAKWKAPKWQRTLNRNVQFLIQNRGTNIVVCCEDKHKILLCFFLCVYIKLQVRKTISKRPRKIDCLRLSCVSMGPLWPIFFYLTRFILHISVWFLILFTLISLLCFVFQDMLSIVLTWYRHPSSIRQKLWPTLQNVQLTATFWVSSTCWDPTDQNEFGRH